MTSVDRAGPLIPLAVPNLAGREAEYLQDCITSTYVSSVGPFVTQFEEEVARAAGTTGALAVSTGTAGLHVALHTIGVRPGDLVVMPALTFVASANAVAYCGASPWLFDVSDPWLTLDPTQVEEAFASEVEPGPDGPIHGPTGRRVAALMPVHTLGHPADLDPLVELAARWELPVVADAAAALGARYRERPIGVSGATVSVFSFNGNKTVTAGGGGALASDDRTFLSRARHLSTTARTSPNYDHDEVGFNYRMTNIQAAVGCAQLEQLDDFVTAKRRTQAAYREGLRDLPGVDPLGEADWAFSAHWFAGAILRERPVDAIVALRTALRADGIDARPFWKPMHLQRPYRDAPQHRLSVTDAIWERVLTLPCSTGITDTEIDRVITSVRSHLGAG